MGSLAKEINHSWTGF